MKPFQPTILASWVIAVLFSACSGGASDSAAKTDTTVAATPAASTVDAKQQKYEANKKLASDFIQAIYGDKDSTAIDKYLTDNFIQHNPIMQDGKEWLKTALRPFLSNPHVEKTKVEIKRMAADGDLVWVHFKDVAPNGNVFARVEIFRVENGKLAENWKVNEEVPEKSANKNGAF